MKARLFGVLLFDLAALALLASAVLELRAAPAELELAMPRAAALRAAASNEPRAGEPGVFDLAALHLPDYDPPEVRDDPRSLGLDDLPERVRALNGEELTVRGFPIALELERGRARRFMLNRYPPGCCYGRRPVLDEWLELELEDAIVPPSSEESVLVTGRLEVGELLHESGYALSLYRLQGARLID